MNRLHVTAQTSLDAIAYFKTKLSVIFYPRKLTFLL
jgi:hypothetical protein